MATSFDSSYATASESAAGKATGAFRSHALRTVLAGAGTNLIAALVSVFAAEAIARGSLSGALAFFTATDTPAITTVATVAFAFAALEALFGRRLLPILALPAYWALIAGASRVAGALRHGRAGRWLDAAAGVLFVGLGLRLLAEAWSAR